MNSIEGIQPANGASQIQPTNQITGAAAPLESLPATDVVEISTVARLAAQIAELPEVRTELVERVKAEIAAGTYETPERIEIALTRLMEELTG